MPTQTNLLGSGCPPLQAVASVGFPSIGLTGVGTNQGNALALPSDFNVFSNVAAATGARLPSCATTASPAQVNLADTLIVVNHGANALLLYPPVGGTISTGVANASFSVTAGKVCTFQCVGTNAYSAGLSN